MKYLLNLVKTNCDVDFNNDEEISDNMIKEVYISAKEVNEFLENPGENINNNYRFSTLCINARSIVNPTNFSKIEGLIASLDHEPDVIGMKLGNSLILLDSTNA